MSILNFKTKMGRGIANSISPAPSQPPEVEPPEAPSLKFNLPANSQYVGQVV